MASSISDCLIIHLYIMCCLKMINTILRTLPCQDDPSLPSVSVRHSSTCPATTHQCCATSRLPMTTLSISMSGDDRRTGSASPCNSVRCDILDVFFRLTTDKEVSRESIHIYSEVPFWISASLVPTCATSPSSRTSSLAGSCQGFTAIRVPRSAISTTSAAAQASSLAS